MGKLEKPECQGRRRVWGMKPWSTMFLRIASDLFLWEASDFEDRQVRCRIVGPNPYIRTFIFIKALT
jgi:hypothetical protein